MGFILDNPSQLKLPGSYPDHYTVNIDLDKAELMGYMNLGFIKERKIIKMKIVDFWKMLEEYGSNSE